MTTISKRGNRDVGGISATEAFLELSSKLIMMVSWIESRKHELMYAIRRENQMVRELMHTLIQKAERAGNVTKALL